MLAFTLHPSSSVFPFTLGVWCTAAAAAWKPITKPSPSPERAKTVDPVGRQTTCGLCSPLRQCETGDLAREDGIPTYPQRSLIFQLTDGRMTRLTTISVWLEFRTVHRQPRARRRRVESMCKETLFD